MVVDADEVDGSGGTVVKVTEIVSSMTAVSVTCVRLKVEVSVIGIGVVVSTIKDVSVACVRLRVEVKVIGTGVNVLVWVKNTVVVACGKLIVDVTMLVPMSVVVTTSSVESSVV